MGEITMENNEYSKKLKALAGIQENDKKFLNNEEFSETTKEEPEFAVFEIAQKIIEPVENDDKLYNLG